MERQEFHEKCKALQGNVYIPGEWDVDPKRSDTNFIAYWETGGVTGGSCWEDSDPQPYRSDEPEAELEHLDTILEEFDVSFMTYRKIMKMVVRWDKSQHEYYGNRTDYAFKSVSFDDVYDVLKEANYV